MNTCIDCKFSRLYEGDDTDLHGITFCTNPVVRKMVGVPDDDTDGVAVKLWFGCNQFAKAGRKKRAKIITDLI
jgi:hypothetical protein